MKTLITILALVCLSATGFCQTKIADGDVASHRIREGTLEYSSATLRKLIFRWPGGEEIFDLSPLAEHTDMAAYMETWPSGFCNLRWAGLRAYDGTAFWRSDDELPEQVIASFLKTHREDEIQSFIYLGINSEIIDVKLKGKTGIFRVDLKLQNSRRLTLWSMLPDERGKQPSVPTKDIPSKPAHAKSAK